LFNVSRVLQYFHQVFHRSLDGYRPLWKKGFSRVPFCPNLRITNMISHLIITVAWHQPIGTGIRPRSFWLRYYRRLDLAMHSYALRSDCDALSMLRTDGTWAQKFPEQVEIRQSRPNVEGERSVDQQSARFLIPDRSILYYYDKNIILL